MHGRVWLILSDTRCRSQCVVCKPAGSLTCSFGPIKDMHMPYCKPSRLAVCPHCVRGENGT
jgi:hypothetical protein